MNIEINNLTFKYGEKEVLHGISTNFSSGEITVIAGPNGSGKSTLVKAINSLIKIKPGTIFIDNRDILKIPIIEKSRLIGYIPQHSDYDFDYTVFEIVEMGRYSFKKEWDRRNDKKAIIEALKTTDTYRFINRPISTLSGGEVQRVLLARALAGEPKYLILDEPSSNLDISHNIEMMRLLKSLTKKLNITTIIVLHDINTMLHYGDQLRVLIEGKLEITGSIEESIVPQNIKKIFNVESEIVLDKNGVKHIIIS